jgi:signal transduction histidine kinase
MTARARKLGGTLSVQSKPAQGTVVIVDLPKNTRTKELNPER